MSLEYLAEMSRRYSANTEYVSAGGGNASYKEAGVLYTRCLSAHPPEIEPERLFAMDIDRLLEAVEQHFPEDMSDDEKEAKARMCIQAALRNDESCLAETRDEENVPGTEAVIHAMLPYKFVLHLHPPLINGLTCSVDGMAACRWMLGDKIVWVGLAKPGLDLARTCKKALDEYGARSGKYPPIVLLENHGIIAAADSIETIDSIMFNVMKIMKGYVNEVSESKDIGVDITLACSLAPAFRMLYARDGMAISLFCVNRKLLEFISDHESFRPLSRSITPDQVSCCKDEPLFIEQDSDYEQAFNEYAERKGFMPRIVVVRKLGFFALGQTIEEASQSRGLFLDAVRIVGYARAFGGVKPLAGDISDSILNGEATAFCGKVQPVIKVPGRLEGRIAIVTGTAHALGREIARLMAAEGAYIASVDMDLDGAMACATMINTGYGSDRAIAIAANVSDEKSVERMVRETVFAFGGLDVLVSNAGIQIAGELSSMTKKRFEQETGYNYTGFFLCTKYAIETMKLQNRYAPEYLMDIIDIRAKSGLRDNGKNSTYSMSKCDGAGLTQNFAAELVEYGIKVNSICPGNLFDDPTWSDPEQGLFRQYLDSGKIPGAMTIGDVRRSFESRVPLKRGCTAADITRAIIYAIEQRYETGQIIPVTGG